MTGYTSHQWCPICNRVTLHKDGKCAVHMQVTEATNKTWIKTSNSTYPEVHSTSECPMCGKVINQCKCQADHRISITTEQYASWVRTVELLQDVADSGVEYEAIGYVTVQIDDCVWEDIKEWRKGEEIE